MVSTHDQGEHSIVYMQFVRDVARGFIPSWRGIAERSAQKPFSEHQRQWQLQRRGAYVCFNLLYDRGVKFGAQVCCIAS